jgi:hypothetical protein
MFLIPLPLLLFASAPDGYQLLSCESYDWLTNGLDRSTAMTARDQSDIRFILMEQTDPTCFELEAEDARAD